MINKFFKNKSGASMVEFAIILPIFMIIIIGVVQGSRYYIEKSIFESSADDIMKLAYVSDVDNILVENKKNLFLSAFKVETGILNEDDYIGFVKRFDVGSSSVSLTWATDFGSLPGKSSKINLDLDNLNLPYDPNLKDGDVVYVLELYRNHNNISFVGNQIISYVSRILVRDPALN